MIKIKEWGGYGMKSVYVWVIFIIGMIIAYFALNNIYTQYKTVEIKDYNTYCDDNGDLFLRTNIMGMGDLTFATRCLEYRSSRCLPNCENGKPVCRCEAVLLDQLMNSPGSWMFR